MYHQTAVVDHQPTRHEVQLSLELHGGFSETFLTLRRFIRKGKSKAERTQFQMDLLERLQAELQSFEPYAPYVDVEDFSQDADAGVELEVDPRQGWSLDAIEKIHLTVFEASMKGILHWKTAERDRIELLSWMLIEDEAPFSWNVCCGLAGVESEDMRHRILHMVTKEHPSLVIPDAMALNSRNEVEKLLARGAAYFGASR